MTANTSQATPSGIGGWLFLVAVGVCLTPLRLGADIVTGMRALDPATWHAVTTPGTRVYHPLFGPLIVGELAANAGLLAWAVVLIYLLFARRRSFPVAMIAFIIVRVAIHAADFGLVLMIPAAAARVGPATYGALVANILIALIWVPYFIRSRRVKTTFVR